MNLVLYRQICYQCIRLEKRVFDPVGRPVFGCVIHYLPWATEADLIPHRLAPVNYSASGLDRIS